MGRANLAGTALRALCLPLTLQLLVSCGRPAAETRTKPSELEELRQNVEAVKNNPSLQPGSNLAGAPLHFSPYPPPRGKTQGGHDEHASHEPAKH